ncbi:unnamed protein product [Brachionus calyciflorus]|uniref:Uncharacterized protein n=1 Tax=Brachionus calyciflorus TaxID=104777 RepID=A0A813MD71_9BILA|nr:unnamed protein product [Brachionus calyciflorus]
MEGDKITLPCGFTTAYQNIINQPDNFECIVCKDHVVNKQECLSMKRNVLVTKQEKVKNEYEKLKTLKEDIDRLSLDRDNTLKESFSSIKNKVDLRREELKKKIDDYYFQILEEIENIQSETALIEINKIDLENLKLIPFSCKQNYDPQDKLSYLDEYLRDIDRKILNLNKLIGELKIGEFYKLTTPKDDLNISNFFGKIEFEVNLEKQEQKSVLIDGSIYQLTCHKSLDIGQKSICDFEFTFDNKLLIAENDFIYLYRNSKCQKKYLNENSEKLCAINNELFAVDCNGKILISEIETGNYYVTIETGRRCFFSRCLMIFRNDKLMSLSNRTIAIWNYKTGKRILEYTEEKRISVFDEVLNGYICLAIESLIKIVDLSFSNCDPQDLRNKSKVLRGHNKNVTCLRSLDEKG